MTALKPPATLGDLLREYKQLTMSGGVIEAPAPPIPYLCPGIVPAPEPPAPHFDWQDRAPDPPDTTEAHELRGKLYDAVHARWEPAAFGAGRLPEALEIGIVGHTGESWSAFKLRASEGELRAALALVNELPMVTQPMVEYEP